MPALANAVRTATRSPGFGDHLQAVAAIVDVLTVGVELRRQHVVLRTYLGAAPKKN